MALFSCNGIRTRPSPWALVIRLAIVAGVLQAGGERLVAATRHNAWPGSREGLVFLWEDERHTHKVGGRTCRAEARGQARIGPTLAMNLARGAFVAKNADGALLAACKRSNQLAVEAVITPDNVTQRGPARIVTFSIDALSRNFTLGQEHDTLIFRLRTPRTHVNGAQISLCKIRPGKTIHVVVSYRSGLLHCCVDGRKIFSTHAVKGDFSNWAPHHLLFGDEWNGHRDWAGQLSNVAVYSRFITAEEAAQKYALYAEQLKRRKPAKSGATYPAKASPAERQALDSLAREIRGAVVYTTRNRRVKKAVIGQWRPIDLGQGDYARWGPEGKRIAVLHRGAIYVMNADGTNRKKVVAGGVSGGDGCQMEFHANGREILYCLHAKSVWSVDIANGKTRSLGLPFRTELGISADGKRLVGRNRGCQAVELPGKKYRRYAGGCAPGISPDGQWLMNNTGSHKTVDIRNWNGGGKFSITTETCRPDRKWDNQHWSNHNDYIGVQGEGAACEAYVFRVSKNLGTRVSWEGRVRYPDLFVAGEQTAGPPRERRGKHVAQPTPTNNARTPGGGVAAKIRELTGSPTRLVWCQAAGGKTILCGLDTEDDAGVRVIPGQLSGWAKPMLTPDGSRVVFSNRITKKICVVNWDGSGPKELCRGFASDVWQDPATGVQWVYYRDGDGREQDPVVRCRLDNPAAKERVWYKTKTGHKVVPWFQLSADGRRAGDAFPWGKCGVADPAKGTWEQYGSGCWTSMAPDNSYRFFWFLGTHKDIGMFDAGKRNRRTIKVNGGPGVNGSKMYFPRWSNHVRFLTVIGPQFSTKAELFLGRFNSSFTAVEKWVRVTHNDRADSFGDAWIGSGARLAATPVREPVEHAPPKDLKKYKDWPGNQEGLVFLWANSNSTNQIIRPDGNPGRTCRVKARGSATFGRFYDMDLAGGAAVALDVNRALLHACKQSNQLTIEAVITPDNVTQGGPARIVTFSNDAGSRNFTLGQHRDRLVLRLRTPRTGRQGAPPETSLCKLRAGHTLHVLVSYTPGRLCCYVDGKEVVTTHKVQGDFSNWTPHHFLLGDEWNGARDWAGRLEGIAIYSRAVGADEAAHKYSLYAGRLRKRQPAKRLVVEGTLRKVTKTPALKDLQEYARALVVYSYEIRKVLSGNINEKEIQVAHWAILDRKKLASIGKRKIGAVYRLELESFDDHPQLESERRFNDCENLDAPLFYDVVKGKVVLGRPHR